MDTLEQLSAVLSKIEGGKDATKAQLITYIKDHMGVELPATKNKTFLWAHICGTEAKIPVEIREALDESRAQTVAAFQRAADTAVVRPKKNKKKKGKKKKKSAEINDLDTLEPADIYRKFMLTQTNEQMKFLATLLPETRVAMLFVIPDIHEVRALYQKIHGEQKFIADEMFEAMSFAQRRDSYFGPRSRDGQVAPLFVQVKLAPDPNDEQDASVCSQGDFFRIPRNVPVDLPWGAFNALKDALRIDQIATGEKNELNLPVYDQVEVHVHPFQVIGTIMPADYGFADKSYIPEPQQLAVEIQDL